MPILETELCCKCNLSWGYKCLLTTELVVGKELQCLKKLSHRWAGK